MNNTGRVVEKIDDKNYTVQIFNGGPTKTVLDLNPVISGGYVVDDTVIVASAKTLQGTLFYLNGRTSPPKPKNKTLINENSVLTDYETIQDITPILAGIPSLPGDLFISHPSAVSAAFIGLLSGGALLTYVSPRSYSLMTKQGDYYLSTLDFEENTLAFVKRIMHHNITVATEDVSIWEQTFGRIVGDKTYRNICESSRGYVGNMTSAITKHGDYGTWQQVGNFLYETSADGNYSNISYLKKGAIGTDALKYNLKISDDGLDIQWGNKTNKITMTDTAIELGIGKSSLEITTLGVVVKSPSFDVNVTDSNYLKMRSTSTILGNANGIKLASSAGVEIADTGSYKTEETATPNVRPSVVHKAGIDILGSLTVSGIDKQQHNVVHDSFLTMEWKPFLKAFDAHTHASPGAPPVPLLLPLLGMPIPINENNVLSVGSL